MSQQPTDDGGLVRQALTSAVASHGIGILSDPRALGEVAGRLLPGLPWASNLLVAAARADVASSLRQLLLQQHADPATATAHVARELARQSGIDGNSCEWVAAEIAGLLGYPVQPPGSTVTSPPQVMAQAEAQPQQPWVPAQPTAALPQQAPVPPQQQWGIPQQPPASLQQQWDIPQQQWGSSQQPGTEQPGLQQPGLQQPGYSQPGYAQPGYAQPGQQQPGAGWPGAPAQMPLPGQPPGRSGSGRRTAVVAVVAVVVVLLAYVGVAAGTHIFPFSRSGNSNANGGLTTHNNKKPEPSPSSSTPAIASLTQLLPQDIDDPTTDCSTINPPYDWSMNGVVAALGCLTVPGLPNGTVFAFQLDNMTDYQTAFSNYNQWQGFSAGNQAVEATCPPAKAGDDGTEPYSNYAFPQITGQVLECAEGSSNQPVYTWSLPSEYAFIVATGGAGTTFAQMQTWWTDDGAPAAFPTPAPSS